MPTPDNRPRLVALFGIFDGVHDGHRDLFRQARKYGGQIVVIVGRDRTVLQLKNRYPRFSEKERVDRILRETLVDNAVLGDEELSTYKVVRTLNPDVICLGYDQHELGADIRTWMEKSSNTFPIYYLKAHHPKLLHNSILRYF